MLQLPQQYISCAPNYLTNPKYKISTKESDRAHQLLVLYEHLQKNAKGISNFQMVWGQYQTLFIALGDWLKEQDPKSVVLINSLSNGINLPWQQKPNVLLRVLEDFTNQLFFIAHFEEFKPAIRVWIESWFFLQKSEMRRLEQDDQILLKERNNVNGVLDRLMRLRKSGVFKDLAPGGLSIQKAANESAISKNEMAKKSEKSTA